MTEEITEEMKTIIKTIPLEQLCKERIDIVPISYADKIASYKGDKIKELEQANEHQVFIIEQKEKVIKNLLTKIDELKCLLKEKAK